jgi:hypothetical protein
MAASIFRQRPSKLSRKMRSLILRTQTTQPVIRAQVIGSLWLRRLTRSPRALRTAWPPVQFMRFVSISRKCNGWAGVFANIKDISGVWRPKGRTTMKARWIVVLIPVEQRRFYATNAHGRVMVLIRK